MRTEPYAYPKRFRLTGLIELTYRDYNTTSKYHGRTSESSSSSFEQRYKLGLQGYVYHPKLVSFKVGLLFRRIDSVDNSDIKHEAKDIGYDFSASILRANPVSLHIYGLKTDSTIEDWSSAPYSISSSYYGARLHITKRNFPSAIIEYYSWRFTIEREIRALLYHPYKKYVLEGKRVKEESSISTISANINGFFNSINTRYSIVGSLTDYKSPFRKYEIKNIMTTTYTTLKQEVSTLSTSFQYSDIDYKKLTMFRTDLGLNPIKKLHLDFGYEYLTFESEKEEAQLQTVSNYLLYRFSRLVFGTTHLRYTFGRRNDNKEDTYDIKVGLNYGKSIKDYDFTSYYKFSISKDERRGEYKYMNNSFGVGMSTRRFKFARIYTNYDLSIGKYDYNYTYKEGDFFESDFEDIYVDLNKLSAKGDYTEHKIRIGVSGTGPRRAYWNIEAESRIFDSKIVNHGTVFWIGEEQWAEKIRHHTLTGDIGYPLGQKGLVTAKASYTTGQTNSEDVQKYYYELRFNYRILRNLNLIAWWREDWRNKGWWGKRTFLTQRLYGWKTREYQMEIYYVLYRIKLSLEYNVYKVEEGPFTSEYRRIYLKASRPF